MTLSIENRLDIQELYARWNHFADTGDFEGNLSLVTDDIHYSTHLREIHGVDEMRAYLAPRADGLTSAPVRDEQHWVNNIVLDPGPDADTVLGRAFMVGIGRDAETGAVRFNHFGHYHDTIVRVEGKWKFKERLFEEHMRHFPES